MNSLPLQPGTIDADFPLRLFGDHTENADQSAIHLRGKLPRGRYRLKIRVREAEHNQLLVIFRDGRPIDSLGVPFWGDSDDNWPESRRDRVTGERLEFVNDVKQRYGLEELYEERKQQAREWTLESSLIINADDPVEIVIRNSNGDRCGPLFYKGDGVDVLGVEVAEDERPAPHSFDRRHPGLPMLDAWGWMVYLGFDNPDRRDAGYEEVWHDAVVTARKWGANLLEMNPSIRDGHFFDFASEGGELPGLKRSPTTRWTTERLRELFRETHERGMLVELFLFSLGGFEHFRNLTSEEILTFYRRVNRLFGCGETCERTRSAIDGVIYEMFPHDAPRQTDEAWRNNPTVLQMVSGGITGTAMELKNNGYSAGFANYTAHWVGADAHQTGYDWLFPAVPYPKGFYRRRGEISFSYLQGCAESHRPWQNRMMESGGVRRGVPARDAAPDWIFSQITAFAGRRWRDEDDIVASVLGWEAVGDLICPPSTKRAVYAVSQDPIRCCLTGKLKDTGRAGTIDVKRQIKKEPSEELVRLLPRHEFPAETKFIRNQELELLMLPGRDCPVLNLDLSRSARFYGNGSLVRLFAPLLATAAPDTDVLDTEIQTEFMEKGGALAVAEQRMEVEHADHAFRETRRITMFNDTPGLRLDISREVTGRSCSEQPLVPGIVAPDAHYRLDVAERTEHWLTLRMSDPEGVLPEAALRLHASGSVIQQVETDQGLTFTMPLESTHKLRAELMLANGHLADEDPLELLEEGMLEDPAVHPVRPGDCPLQIPVRSFVESTGVVGVKHLGEGPARVQERGWWHYRGVTPSDRFPNVDYLRVHYHPGSRLEVANDSPILGEITWGPGSQYSLLIGDVERDGDWLKVPLRVANSTPFIFAPRVRLRAPAARLRLDGEGWQYADGDLVALPNRPGDYELAWQYGEVAEPRICRTCATVLSTSWEDSTLSFQTALPDHVVEDPEYHDYYALIDWQGRREVRRIEIGRNTLSGPL